MSGDHLDSPEDITQVIGLTSRRPWYRQPLVWGAVVLAVVLAAIVISFIPSSDTATLAFKSAEVKRGELTVTVTATGALEPVNQVDIGTEISGTVKSVAVDFNDRVKAGQVLARLDTEQLEARLRQSRANLSLAEASVKEAEATVRETRNRLDRALVLQKQGLCSQEECDTAQATYDRASATLAKAKAQVVQAKAQLDAERSNLTRATIHSPIDGIVLKRQIEPGQTVAAAFQTPVLFTIAENLTQMQLKIGVDEADVGHVHEGQAATFSVDAWPARVFPATIMQVRFAPQTIEGVVSYEAVLSVDNSDLALRPGMTATAEIVVKQIDDALLVPNVALRFRPPVQPAAAESRGILQQLIPHRPRRAKEKTSSESSRQMRVWAIRDGEPSPIPITIGDTDGTMTVVVDGELQEGMSVLTDTVSRRR